METKYENTGKSTLERSEIKYENALKTQQKRTKNLKRFLRWFDYWNFTEIPW